jgi:hypothetical protein
MGYCSPGGLSGSLLPGYGGPGYGNVVADRSMSLAFGLHTIVPGADPAAALETLERIDVCLITQLPDQVVCPSSVSQGLSIEASALDYTEVESGAATKFLYFEELVGAPLPFDWDPGPGGERGWFLRAVGTDGVERTDWTQLLDESGACHTWTALSGSDHFTVVGVDPSGSTLWDDPALPGGAFDVCARGQRIAGAGSMCLDQAFAGQSTLAVEILEAIEDSAVEQPPRDSSPSELASSSWANGEDGAGERRPMWLLLGAREGGATSPGGAILRAITHLESVDPAISYTALAGAQLAGLREIVRHMSHEHMHKLQQALVRELPITSGIDQSGLVVEAIPSSLSMGHCVGGILGAPTDACLSGGKLGHWYEGHAAAGPDVVARPWVNPFAVGGGYAAGSFFLYGYEQFSYAIAEGSLAAPGRRRSRAELAARMTALHSRWGRVPDQTPASTWWA